MTVFGRLRGHEVVVVAILGLLMLNGAMPALVVALSERVLAQIADPTAVWRPLAALVVVAFVAPVLQVARAFLSRRLAWQRVHDLRMDVHAALHASRDDLAAGDRLAALVNECDELNVALSALITAVRAPLSVVSLLGAAVWTAPALAVRLFIALPVVATVAFVGGTFVRHLTRRWREARAALFTEATDQYNGLATTLDHDAVEAQIARLERVSQAETSRRTTLEWGKVVPTAALQSLLVLVVAWLLWTAASAVTAGTLAVSEVGAFFVAVALLRGPLIRLSDVWSQWVRANAALERVELFMQRGPPSKAVNVAALKVRCEGVEGRLRPFELLVPPGRKVAVVGASGSGKSSLLAVLSGQLGESSTTARTVLCRQEPWLFRRTLRQNLMLSGDLDDVTARRILDDLGLQELAARLDEDVGEQGMSLSGGQRQRVALGRALLIAGCPLLLDEATSEVEPDRAQAIAELLASLERTVIMATHEPWFAVLAQEVIWMDQGTIRARGTHQQLLADPTYRARWGRGAA